MTDRLVHFDKKQYPSSFHDIPRRSITNTRFETAPYQKDDQLTPFELSLDSNKDLIIPVVEQPKQYKQEQVIKEGLILCTRIEEWYTKKITTTEELELRKTRLRWRQFKAVLFPNKLELYHVTNIIIKAQRLAHVIHLNSEYPYRRVYLSLISSRDYIWSLKYQHYETKRSISFHFQSRTLSEAQDWYMSIYHVLPCTIPACKKPIPSYIDINVILHHQQQPSIKVRLPLEQILKHSRQDTLMSIRMQDVKPVIRSLLQKDGLIRMDEWSNDDIKLCWRTKIASDDPKQHNTALIASGDHTEWITQSTELISPQLIEQSHILELHRSDPHKTAREEMKYHNSNKIISYEGLLINKRWTHPDRKCKKTSFYVVLYGHHLFFMDKSYYYFYKRQNVNIKPQPKNKWFSQTTGLLFQQRKLMISKQNKKTLYQLGDHQSSPHLKYFLSPEAVSPPDPQKLVNARLLLDLNQVTRAQPSTDSANTFEIHAKKGVLYYEAPSTQIMLQWVTLINSMLKLNHLVLHSIHSHCHEPEERKSKRILQSGFLYVKHNYKRSFQPQYCVLAKSADFSGLMMFDTLKQYHDTKHIKQWFNCCGYEAEEQKQARKRGDIVEDHMQQRTELTLYEKKRLLVSLNNAYVYSGDECLLDQLIAQQHKEKIEPLRYYKDGQITGGNKTSECVFVIWQIAKRHFVPNFREYLSLLKLGHRLGNRGSCWVFKARSKQERDEWVWALHVEFGLLKI